MGNPADLSKKRIKDAMKKNQSILDNALALNKQNILEVNTALGDPEINIMSYSTTQALKSPASTNELHHYQPNPVSPSGGN